ncbi:MAG: PAS domain S-box protein [Alphaproteobacteria bacterium]|nr:PAS domain S-box protein [Alphaproteobacteria bacterium]
MTQPDDIDGPSQGRDAVAELRDSEARQRLITATMPVPLMLIGPDEVVCEVNPAATEVLGAPSEAIVGRHFSDFVFEPTAYGEYDDEMRRSGGVRRVEIRMRRPDGSPFWVLGSAQALPMSGGRIGRLVVFQDLSDQKRRQQELNAARERAERTIRARMRFFAAASHDLRQPLQALALFVSAIDAHLQGERPRSVLQNIKSALKVMEDMFEALLDVSRADAGVLKAEMAEIQIGDLFEPLEMEFGPQAAAAGVALRVVPSSATVSSDPKLLARILRNFLSNAVRYTQHGKILLGCRRRGGRLRIEVWDTGPGIAEDQRLAIFEEFYRGEGGSDRKSGVGLGLAIVQRLARLLQHPLDVRSARGKGSVFSVEVPLIEPAFAAGPEPGLDEVEDAPDVSGLVVAVVDDDADILRGLTLLFEDWGVRAVTGPTGERVVASLAAQGLAPDLVLSDLRLGRQDGIAAIEAINDAVGVKVPAILFTGDCQGLDKVWEHPVLLKPLNTARLRVAMAEAVGRRTGPGP